MVRNKYVPISPFPNFMLAMKRIDIPQDSRLLNHNLAKSKRFAHPFGICLDGLMVSIGRRWRGTFTRSRRRWRGTLTGWRRFSPTLCIHLARSMTTTGRRRCRFLFVCTWIILRCWTGGTGWWRWLRHRGGCGGRH
jgi:hypothetical protein